MIIKDPNLIPLWKKVQDGVRLSPAEGLTLFASDDLFGLAHMANWVKEQKTGNRATFVVNRQINPTNVCVLSCRFCDYATKAGKPRAYIMSKDDILAKCSDELREVHIVSGLYNGWSFEEYLDVIRVIRQKYPLIQVKAYTAVEIEFFSRREKQPLEKILQRMIDVGVVCIPGGGAEVFSERVRKALYPFKIGAPKWLEVHRTAHKLGLRSNSTLLYGHMETLEERITHMMKLRDLQDETKGFLSFIPLAYQPGTTKVVDRQTSVIDDLKTIAVSRLMLDNFDHIKAYWVTMGEETASIALNFGADDIDGTIGEEKIMHAAQASSPLLMARERLVSLIRESARVPVERDCLYQEVKVFDLALPKDEPALAVSK
jgi:aminodeoxyfutalosine synthase